MHNLFPDESLQPPGFSYHPEFISVDEEEELLHFISGLQLHTFLFRGYEAKRKVLSLGYEYSFDLRSIKKGEPIPSQFDFLIRRVEERIGGGKIRQLLVIEYPVGAVINWHRDAPPFDAIAGVSLLSDCKFKMRPYEKALQNRKSVITHHVARRSLYIMKDEARENWEHSIDKMKQVRYSVTMRTLREDRL